LLLFLFVLCPRVEGALTAYPTPPNAVKSSVFTLVIAGTEVPVMKHMDYHYAHFSFSGPVEVRVRAKDPVTTHRISPASLGIQGRVSGHQECDEFPWSPASLGIQGRVSGRDVTFSITQAE
jgi:hypothetical protein